MTHKFTSLRHPVEKLLEAEHFVARLAASHGLQFQFELNALLSSARSVSFVLQKSMSSVPGFEPWYAEQRAEMRADPAMRFFHDLRNISQKQGPVSFIGGSRLDGGWTYRFVSSNVAAVPSALRGRDLSACCAEHIIKLANLVLRCFRMFPFHSCPGLAFTEQGMAVLAYTFFDVEDALGLPRGYTDVGEFPASEKLRVLSRDIEPLQTSELERIARGDLQDRGTRLTFPRTDGTDLLDDIARFYDTDPDANPRDAFLLSIGRRMNEH